MAETFPARRRWGAALALAALALAGGAAFLLSGALQRAADPQRGAALYAEHCASCHGAGLEGEPDWKEAGEDGLLPAPPHDASGHTWHHSDALLTRIVREGSAAVIGGGYESGMPGFGPGYGDVLTEAEIAAILGFIKSTWPERERAFQAQVSAQDR